MKRETKPRYEYKISQRVLQIAKKPFALVWTNPNPPPDKSRKPVSSDVRHTNPAPRRKS